MPAAFWRFWCAETAGVLAAQFTAIAFPWLVLQLTGSAANMGAAFAIVMLPFTLVSLLAGALADRYSPRRMLILSRSFGALMAALLALCVISDHISLPLLYAISATSALMDALAAPAYFALQPQILGQDQLHRGNALLSGTLQFGQIAGPGLGGLLIGSLAALAEKNGVPAAHSQVVGCGYAFAAGAAGLCLSILLLLTVRPGQPSAKPQREPMLKEIRSGLRITWQVPGVRVLLIMAVLTAPLMGSVLRVGVPVLANLRFSGGAIAFGGLLSAIAAGGLFGTLAAFALPRPRMDWLLRANYAGIILCGALFAGLGYTGSFWVAAGIIAINGAVGQFMAVHIMTWLQTAVPSSHTGRVLSVLMFVVTATMPPALLLAGALAQANLQALFTGTGAVYATVGLMLLMGKTAQHFAPQTTPAA